MLTNNEQIKFKLCGKLPAALKDRKYNFLIGSPLSEYSRNGNIPIFLKRDQ